MKPRDRTLRRRQKAAFLQFSSRATPSEAAVTALGGVREITDGSVGRWRSHLPRLAGQIQKYGPIDDLLEHLGYADKDWMEQLEGIEPDFRDGFIEDHKGHRPASATRRLWVSRWNMRLRFLMGRPLRAASGLQGPQ